MDIGVVLVTFNRLDKLKSALACYEAQSVRPKYMIVVDNCSTDGTSDFLKEWKAEEQGFEKEVLILNENTGGAGGFYAGMERGLCKEADWIWLSDDDAYPRTNAFEKLVLYYEKQSENEQKTIAALCSSVYNCGKLHAAHRNHLKITKFKCRIYSSTIQEYQKEAFEVDIFSYVGVLIRKTSLEKAGLDCRDFFIYCDDQEHSIRLGRTGRLICVTDSIVDHDTPPFNKDVLNWGLYYKKRNDLLMIKRNFSYRYFLLRFLRRYLGEASVFSKFPKEHRRVHRAAFLDAFFNRSGVHEIYRPGWKP